MLMPAVATCPGPALHCCRFESLRGPLGERRTALEARSLLLQFFRDADEEMAWVQEKLPLAAARDSSQSLSALRHLQEKHQVGPPQGRLHQPERWPCGPTGGSASCGFWGRLGFFVGHKDREVLGGKSLGSHEASGTTLGTPRSAQ